jgi:hypothetical protein
MKPYRTSLGDSSRARASCYTHKTTAVRQVVALYGAATWYTWPRSSRAMDYLVLDVATVK